MSKGLYSTQDGHWVPLLYPVDETGGKTLKAFSTAMYAHVSILLMIGVSAAAPGAITVNACSDAAGDNPTAIAFNLFKGETTDTDTLGARTAVTSAGYTPPATDKIFYVIELDAEQLPQGFPYVQVALADATNSVIASAVAYLSGARQACDQSPTVLT